VTKTDKIRIALVAAPTVLAIGLLTMGFVKKGHYERDVEQRVKVETQISALLRALEEQSKRPVSREAAVADVPNEESDFLDFVRQSARLTGVKLVRWSANPRPGGGSVAAKPRPEESLKEVLPLSGTLTAMGPYRQILAFAHRITSHDRLVNLSNVTWNRPEASEARTQLTAILTRYIVVPAPPAPATPPSTNP